MKIQVALEGILTAFLLSSPLLAQSVEPVTAPTSQAERVENPPPQMALLSGAPPAATLPSADEGARDQLESMKAWNRMGIGPEQNGFSRPLPQPLGFQSAQAGSPTAEPNYSTGYLEKLGGGELAWGTSVSVSGAYRLRLHFSRVTLPSDAHMWVYGLNDRATEFGLEAQGPTGDIWTPSVHGNRIFFEVRIPAEAAQANLVADGVLELFATRGSVAPLASLSCMTDATCVDSSTFPAIASARGGVAQLQFVEGGSSFLCSGGLLNNTKGDFTPYLLTAGHCFSDQSAAASLEAFWDFKTPSCLGTVPNENTLPKSNGSTLLATGAAGAHSDFTFVRLNGVPPGRAFLGWNANASAVAPGVNLYRVSHPAPTGFPFPQSFSSTVVSSAAPCAAALPTSRFIYSSLATGGTFGGSSGSPVMLANGQVVGQLFGECGPTAQQGEGCDPANKVVDGAFSATFPALSQWLNPAVSSGPCVRDANTACLQNNRFEVKISFNNDSNSGNAAVMNFGPTRAEGNESAFYFFESSTNFEMGVKVLNACIPQFQNKFWVFISGLTDQGWTVNVRDTTNGVVKTYSNTLHHLSTTFADTQAFDCN